MVKHRAAPSSSEVKRAGLGELLLSAMVVILIAGGFGIYSWWQDRQAAAEARRIELAAPQYGQWTDQMIPEAIRTMSRNGFDGHWAQCGVIRYRVDFIHPGRYLVRCSPGADAGWSEYIVDAPKNSVSGPFEPNKQND